MGDSHSHWAYWVISHVFSFLSVHSPSEFCPVHIRTRNHIYRTHPSAQSSHRVQSCGGSRGASSSRHCTLLTSLESLQPAQARLPLFSLADTKRPELKSETIQLALNRHSFALVAQCTSPSNTTKWPPRETLYMKRTTPANSCYTNSKVIFTSLTSRTIYIPEVLRNLHTFTHRTNQTQKTSYDLHLQISRLVSDIGQL